MKPPRAPDAGNVPWLWSFDGLSSGPASALTGRASSGKSLNLFELNLPHLQNGAKKAMYCTAFGGGAMNSGSCKRKW